MTLNGIAAYLTAQAAPRLSWPALPSALCPASACADQRNGPHSDQGKRILTL